MLVNVPLRDQLAEPTQDHQPDENASANCVPASLSAAFSALTGDAYFGDELKDAVYGEGYTGATDPARFIAYAAQQGIHMWEVDSDSGDVLVETIHQQLAQGHPVAGAIPSMWGNTTAADIAAHGGPTHEVMFCDGGNGWLTAMNPWPVDGHNAFYQRMDDGWWASRLVYRHVHPLERMRAMSNVRPVWDGGAGTLTYPAHDGLPQIVLDHGQAAYANSSRPGCYPLKAGFYLGDDSVVLWNDGQRTRAVKAEGWTVHLEEAGPELAAALAQADQVSALEQQVKALQAQLAAALQQGQETPQDKAARLAVQALKLALQ